MQNFDNVPDFFQAAPPGWYLSRCTAAEPHIKDGKAPMIHLTWEVIDQRFAGQQAHHYITTDGNVKGAAATFAKQALRGLGVEFKPGLVISDTELCQAVLGREYYVKYENDRQMSKDSSGDYTIPVTAFDFNLGKEVELKKLVVQGYMTPNTFSKRQTGGGNGATTGQANTGAVMTGTPATQQALPSTPAGYSTLGAAPAGQPTGISPAVAAKANATGNTAGNPPFLRD